MYTEERQIDFNSCTLISLTKITNISQLNEHVFIRFLQSPYTTILHFQKAFSTKRLGERNEKANEYDEFASLMPHLDVVC